MSYQAKVFKVFIASPSDVAQERAIIRQILSRWNNINSESYKIVFLPIGWETHSSPAVGDSPQDILNEQILTDCDLLIGVFWTRFGTPTENYESGTEEEIEKHIKTGKPTMLYFSNKPVHPDSIDEKQYSKVKTFKEKYQNKSVYHEYSSIEEFQQKLSDHIQLKINNHDYFGSEVELRTVDFTIEENDIASSLSKEATIILEEGIKDQLGYIFALSTTTGKIIQTNGKKFNGDNPRERAQWESALEELERENLIKSTNFKKESFKITKRGYEVADLI